MNDRIYKTATIAMTRRDYCASCGEMVEDEDPLCMRCCESVCSACLPESLAEDAPFARLLRDTYALVDRPDLLAPRLRRDAWTCMFPDGPVDAEGAARIEALEAAGDPRVAELFARWQVWAAPRGLGAALSELYRHRLGAGQDLQIFYECDDCASRCG